ncbi:MAG: hypothetical protein H7Y19_17650 [Luteimonas sp.]|nr:hypothetical protein [Luteimonas sp.]
MSSLKIQVCIATAVFAAASFAPSAEAAPVNRDSFGTAAGLCTPAFGPSETAIRKRPLSVQNEGTTNAFVTCSFMTEGPVSVAYVYVNSYDAAVHTITCTGVNGYTSRPTNAYVPKSIDAPADGSQEYIEWVPTDFGGTTVFPSSYFSVSCALPPGAGVNDIGMVYSVEIGT